jgi:hypothetical protein
MTMPMQNLNDLSIGPWETPWQTPQNGTQCFGTAPQPMSVCPFIDHEINVLWDLLVVFTKLTEYNGDIDHVHDTFVPCGSFVWCY